MRCRVPVDDHIFGTLHRLRARPALLPLRDDACSPRATADARRRSNDTLVTMDWIAPPADRPAGSMTAPEALLLPGLLSWHRATLLAKCAGLTAEQLAERSVPPSNLSLLGLLRHLRKVERVWFRTRVAQEPVAPLHGFGTGVDEDFEQVDAVTAAADYDAFVAETRAADAAVAGHDLDEEFDDGRGPYSLRYVYLHLIGEYARHNGHADLVRERIDRATGH